MSKKARKYKDRAGIGRAGSIDDKEHLAKHGKGALSPAFLSANVLYLEKDEREQGKAPSEKLQQTAEVIFTKFLQDDSTIASSFRTRLEAAGWPSEEVASDEGLARVIVREIIPYEMGLEFEYAKDRAEYYMEQAKETTNAEFFRDLAVFIPQIQNWFLSGNIDPLALDAIRAWKKVFSERGKVSATDVDIELAKLHLNPPDYSDVRKLLKRLKLPIIPEKTGPKGN